MSTPSNQADAGTESRSDRLRPWIAALVTALLHLLIVLIAMWSPPITMTTPQGAAGGSRMEVTFIDLQPPPPTVTPTPPVPKPAARKAAKALPAASRVRTTRVVRADDPVPPDAVVAADTPTPPDVPYEAAQDRGQSAADSPPPPTRRPAQMWGQPPGMLPEDVAAANADLADSPALDRGRSNDPSASGPDMEVDGYHVYYDLFSERRLRAWRDEGMTELFLPLPGTKRLMVCPLEVALRRGSGACRMVEPDSPELKAIGDARDVINMQMVSRLGDVLWRGPGPYK